VSAPKSILAEQETRDSQEVKTGHITSQKDVPSGKGHHDSRALGIVTHLIISKNVAAELIFGTRKNETYHG
jgi:hypothetical protein